MKPKEHTACTQCQAQNIYPPREKKTWNALLFFQRSLKLRFYLMRSVSGHRTTCIDIYISQGCFSSQRGN